MLVVVGALVVAFGGGQWPDKWPESIGNLAEMHAQQGA